MSGNELYLNIYFLLQSGYNRKGGGPYIISLGLTIKHLADASNCALALYHLNYYPMDKENWYLLKSSYIMRKDNP